MDYCWERGHLARYFAAKRHILTPLLAVPFRISLHAGETPALPGKENHQERNNEQAENKKETHLAPNGSRLVSPSRLESRMIKQMTLQAQLELTVAAQRVLCVLESVPGWIRMEQLAVLTGMNERNIRKLIGEELRAKGYDVISGPDGYKISASKEESDRSADWMMTRAITGMRNYAIFEGVSLMQAISKIRTKLMMEGLS